MSDPTIRVFFERLKSRHQLKNISCQRVVNAGFTDDTNKFFCIEFDRGNGKHQDLMISFETRTPRVHISRPYFAG